MWDKDKYLRAKDSCLYNIKNGVYSKSQYMEKYIKAIEEENYEMAKAITDVLANFGMQTANTHKHIKSLNETNGKSKTRTRRQTKDI